MILKNIQFALRTMRRSPVVSAAVILTVAIAIAANTAIFSLVNAVMLRPLPFTQPDRILQVAEKNDKLGIKNFGASVLNFVSWREAEQSFQYLAGLGYTNFTLSGSGEPEQFSGNTISPAMMRVLGVSPVLGRSFTDAEEKPGAAPVAMLGEGVWRRRFGADPSVIGSVITLNTIPTTIVGVAPASLRLLAGGDIYSPMIIDPGREIRLNHIIAVFGRLKPGVTPLQAQAEMNTVSARLDKQFPEIRDWGIDVLTMSQTFVSTDLRTGLFMLLGAVGFVLLIACANIANLLLARAASRQKELAVRTAIGASRSQIVQQLLTESVLLASIGGATGILGAVWAVRLMNRSLPPNLLPIPTVPVDTSVLIFAAALTIVTGLLFGIVPSLKMAKIDLNEVLKLAGRGGSGALRARLRNTLAAAELALATILLIGAGLLIQSLANLQRVNLGFDSHKLITFQLSPPVAQYPAPAKSSVLYRSLLESLRGIPGATGAAVSSGIPFGNGNYTRTPFAPVGQSVLQPGATLAIDWRIVSPGYFSSMSVPLLRGRDFTDADVAAAQQVVIVSQSAARKFWGDQDPIGRAITRATRSDNFKVVGMVGDVRDTALNQESPTVYYAVGQRAMASMDVVVRAAGASPEAMLPAIREKVHELDPQLALSNVRTMDDWVSSSAAQPRLNAILLGGFAAMALVIAAIGIYGVLAYSVTQRTQEIGLRIALGAQSGGVLRLVVSEGMRVALAGIAIGLAGGLVLGRVVASLVYGVTAHDPLTFGAVAFVLSAVALAACIIPARRASRVDPIVALRCD